MQLYLSYRIQVQNQPHTSVGQANNIVNEPIICEISDEEELHITHENLNSPNEANYDSKTTSIDEKVKQIANLCRENGISNNAVEILRNLQSGLVVGRDLEISSPDECPEGITNFIMVDRQNLLKTAFEEIGGLSNKLYTLEVQFYNEVYNCLLIYFIVLCISDFFICCNYYKLFFIDCVGLWWTKERIFYVSVT
jgi:hypothetical protein